MDQGGGDQGMVITILIVALSRMTAADKDGVGPWASPSRGKEGSRRPEHIMRMTRRLGGYW